MITIEYVNINGEWHRTTKLDLTMEEAITYCKRMCQITWITYRILIDGVPEVLIKRVKRQVEVTPYE